MAFENVYQLTVHHLFEQNVTSSKMYFGDVNNYDYHIDCTFYVGLIVVETSRMQFIAIFCQHKEHDTQYIQLKLL
ncbi:unnamed protein product [Macrosiphum euphorbiae]|uniref:Uncharacterized protein n=1 Tax=Macrosiphum euphorbiae TaxID=13131 RepID=A0AAV0XV92_9HEMI|nr:unnamed protein product [Macrosiphum euphorbiae]